MSTTGRRRSQLRLTRKLKITLEQRVALRYAMPPMTSQETASYITHHLKLAGRSDPLVSDDATALDRNRQLADDNARLRRQLAGALGDQRSSRTRSGNDPAP